MFKDTPAPIRTTFWKYTLLYCAIVIFGLIWGVVIEDSDLLFLTIAIVAFGTWRTIHLYRIIHLTKYRLLEGVVVSDVKQKLSGGHSLTLQLADGSQIKETVAGNRLLLPAHEYRVYLYCPIQPDVVSSLPEVLRPTQTLLGYEMMD